MIRYPLLVSARLPLTPFTAGMVRKRAEYAGLLAGVWPPPITLLYVGTRRHDSVIEQLVKRDPSIIISGWRHDHCSVLNHESEELACASC